MKPRQILFWAHLVAGVAAGIVILIMCVTGAALGFEKQLLRVVDRASRAPVSAGAERLPMETLLSKLPEGGEGLSGITVYANRDEPVAFAFGRERTLFVDPYNGKFLGQASARARIFFFTIERWHRALGAELRGRGPWRPIADAANFVFLFILISGLYLWLPRSWRAQRLRQIGLLRRNLSGKAALWNIHNVVGIWCVMPLLVIVLSGVIMSYPWANNLLYRLSGTEPPSQGANRLEGQHRRAGRIKGGSSSLPLTTLFDRAAHQVPVWRSISLRWEPGAPVDVFTIDQGNGGQPQARSQLTLAIQDASVKRWEPFSSYPTGRRWRIWARFLHTGEALGVIGQAVASIATFGGAVLVVTGMWMAWMRFIAARRVRRTEGILAASR